MFSHRVGVKQVGGGCHLSTNQVCIFDVSLSPFIRHRFPSPNFEKKKRLKKKKNDKKKETGKENVRTGNVELLFI